MTGRRSLFGAAFSGLLVISPTAAAPQDENAPNGPARALEMPFHQSLMATQARTDGALSPFETDGCSGGLSEVWRLVAVRFPDFAAAHQSAPPWETCCVVHDRAYHDASASRDADTSYAERLAADRDLQACVVETGESRRDEIATLYQVTPDRVSAAYAAIAGAMFFAVRVGGWPCSGLPWRWGFGYAGCSESNVSTQEILKADPARD